MEDQQMESLIMDTMLQVEFYKKLCFWNFLIKIYFTCLRYLYYYLNEYIDRGKFVVNLKCKYEPRRIVILAICEHHFEIVHENLV